MALLPGIKNLKSDPKVKCKVRGKEMSAPVQTISTELETSLWGLGAQIRTRKYRTSMRSGMLNKFPYNTHLHRKYWLFSTYCIHFFLEANLFSSVFWSNIRENEPEEKVFSLYRVCRAYFSHFWLKKALYAESLWKINHIVDVTVSTSKHCSG